MIYHVISAILFYWKCCQGIKYARKVDWFASCDMTSYLNKHLTNVYFSEERRFTYYDPIYVRSFPGFENKYQFLNVSVDSLLQPSKDQSKKCCYYYSGDVTNSPFSALSHLILMNKVFRDFKNIEELNVNIWITQPLLTATLHYDAVNNLFIQIHGSKKVVLYPPRMVGELYIHGRLHPHACQSRLDQYCLTESTNTNTKEDYCSANTDNSDTVTFVAGSSVNVTPYSIVMRKHTKEMFDECWDVGDGIQIDLHAGDVLVIPPFWFHKTVSESASVSLSLWWETPESKVFDEMLAHPLPFESIWSSTVLTKVAFGFINYLLQHTDTLLHIALRVPSVDSAISKLVRTLLSQRYWEDINKYAVCTSDYCDGQKEVSHCSLLHELQPLDSSSHDLDSKVSSYAEQVASVAVKGLVDSVLADMSYTLQYDGKETNDEGDLVILQQYIIRTYGIRLDTEDDDEDYIAMSRNQVKNIEAVLSMKLCDYIEEVFYTITSLLHPERTHSDKVRQVVALLYLYSKS